MGKIKAASRDKQRPSAPLKSMQSSLKKQKKKNDNKGSMNRVRKNDFKKSHESSKLPKNMFPNEQDGKNKKHNSITRIVKSTKKPDSTKHPKNYNETAKVFKKVQANTDFESNEKPKRRRRSRKRKEEANVNQISNNITKVNVSTVKRIKKSKVLAEETGSKQSSSSKTIEQSKMKIRNVKVAKLKKKRMSTKKNIKLKKVLKLNDRKIKIERLKEMLNDKVQTVGKIEKREQPLTLRERMMTQLRASRFRFINETLYNNKSSQSKQYFKEDLEAFKAYHDGYKQQLEQWPVNPLDIIISSIKKMPKDNVIADLGCGEAQLASSVPHTVHSFDFVALNDRVKACDMAHTPLLMNSIHVVVFCLSLMGTNLNDYLVEANRILKNNGILKIAEVESRFENVEDFIKTINRYGFKNTSKDLSHDLFYFMDFKKVEDAKRKNLPPITLKPCLYKKR